MIERFPAVVTIFLCGLTALSGQAPAGRQPSADEVRDLVFLADARPILVRLHLHVDGEPFGVGRQKASERFHESLFRYLDRDGKGWLDEREARRLPPPPTWRSYGQKNFGPANVAFNFQVLDADGDGRVSLQELKDYYRVFGVDQLQIESVLRPTPIPGSMLGDALFKKADRNRDGMLSRAELEKLAASVLQRDQEEDDIVTPDAVLADAPAARQANSRRRQPPFLVLAPGEDTSPLVRALVARYGPKSERFVNEAEMARFPERTPDLEAIIRLGQRQAGQKALEILHSEEFRAGEWRVTAAEGGSLVLDIGDVRLEVQVLRDAADPIIVENRDALRQRFQSLARGKGRLEKREAAADRLLFTLFDLIDRNGDGKLDPQEVEQYLDAVQDKQMRAELSRIQLLVSEEGSGLFDLLDRNRDGRLSRRELQSATKILAPYMRDSAGLRREEIPRSYQFVIGLARYEPAALEAEPPGLPLNGWRTAPRWFRKMDSNQDGDISPREFLGSREQFRKLDKDGDGLISIDEAEAARNK